MNKEKSIDALNMLIEINNDRIQGYETAVNETEEADLKKIFSMFLQTSQKCKVELVTEVNKLGGSPIEGTKISGKVFRVWMDVKAALTGKNRKEILSSCEYGEDAAIDIYNKVLKNDIENITSEQQTLINAQLVLLKADHDKVKSMRDMMVEH